MGLPPSFGAVHETVDVVLVPDVPATEVGASGTTAGIGTLTLGGLVGFDEPTMLLAVTAKV